MGLSRDITARQLAGLSEVSVELVRVRQLPDGRFTRDDAAKYLGLATKTLAIWATQGKGPPFVKIGARCFYYRRDLDQFIAGTAMEVDA
jgi:hypothetical protein